jgi:hypothetical protein
VRKSIYDDAPELARKLITDAITADKPTNAAELFRRVESAGMKKASRHSLRQYVARRRKKAGKTKPRRKPDPIIAGLTATIQRAHSSTVDLQKHPVTVDATAIFRDAFTAPAQRAMIEVLPNGALRTSDPELAVRLSRLLARSAG